MKRPFAIIGFTALLAALCLVSKASTVLAVCGIILFAMGLILSLAIGKKQVNEVSLLCIGGFIACIFSLFAVQTKSLAVASCGENRSIEAVICETPEFSHDKGRYYAVARLSSVSGEKQYGKIRISFSETYDEISSSDLKIGDKVKFTANVYKIGGDSEDVNLYYASKGIFLGCYSVNGLEISSPRFRPLSYYADILRDKISEITFKTFPNKTGGMIIAMLTGDKSHVDGDLYTAFKRSGTAHMLAVSGMHLSVWIMFMTAVLGASRKRKWYSELILALTVVFIMFLASFSPSVVRAGIMCLVTLFGKHISRESDGLNSLGFASLVMMIYNPYLSVNVAFQLSFMSVLAIFILAVPLNKTVEEKFLPKIPSEFLQKIFSVVCGSVTISLSVTLFTFPILALCFGGASLISPLTNLLLMPVSSPIVILSGVNALFDNVPVLSTALSLVLKVLSEYMIFVVEKTDSMFFSYLPYTRESLAFWCVAFTAVLVCLFLFMHKRLNFRRYAVFVIALAFVFAGHNYVSTSITSYNIVHVSESSYIVAMNGRGVLVGVGDGYYYESELADVLEQKRISLDAVVITDSGDEKRINYICAEYGIENRIDSFGESIELFDSVRIENKGNHVLVCGNKAEIAIFSDNGLQQEKKYDIILDNYGLIFADSESADYTMVCSDYSGVIVNVSEKGKISFRGEKIG